jgi:hypothetical protein
MDGQRKPVEVAYLVSRNTYGFTLGDYDPSKELIIDPILNATYLGGSADDPAWSIAFDSSGNVFVTGRTFSTDFPGVDTSSAQTSKLGTQDVYVAKFNKGLGVLYHATYLGGTGYEEPGTGDGGGPSIAIHLSTNNVYVTGWTSSSNFPATANGYQNSRASAMDAYVSVLENSLDSIIRSTYYGGNGDDLATALAIHPTTGDVCITGRTRSTDLPGVSGGAQESHAGATWDGFAACLSSDLTSLRQATYLGGTGEDWPFGITVYDKAGEAYYGSVYIAGDTGSTSFPNAAVNTVDLGGGTDAFVTYLPSSLSQIVWAHRIGGTGGDRGYSVKVHPLTGEVYVSGDTSSTDFPGTDSFAAQPDLGGSSDGFISRMSGGLSVQRKATYFGGTNSETGGTLTINPTTGNVYLVGNTMSTDLPGITGGAQTTNAGDMDIYAAMHSASLFTLHQATYVGGSSRDMGYATGISPGSNDVYVTGLTWSTNFPGVTSTFSAQDSHGGGNQDGYVVRLEGTLTATVEQDIDVSPMSVDFGTAEVGSVRVENIRVSNTGGDNLSVTDISLTNPTDFGFDINTTNTGITPTCGSFAASPALFTLPAGEECFFSVVFQPDSLGSHTADLTIQSNDSDEDEVIVSLEGVGGSDPDIYVTPLSHDFGVIAVEDSVSRVFTITNIGAAALTVSDISLSNDVDFDWDATDCSATLPFELPVGLSCTVTVFFVPSNIGAIIGRLHIQSNDPDAGGTTRIELGGGTDEQDIHVDPLSLSMDPDTSDLISISNLGGTALSIDKIIHSTSRYFEFRTGDALDCPHASFALLPGDKCNRYIHYNRTELDYVYTTISIFSNDPDEDIVLVDVAGRGEDDPGLVSEETCGCALSNTEGDNSITPTILLTTFIFGLLLWRRRRLG